MGVYIKCMEMPISCHKCPLLYVTSICDGSKDCPLVEIPPHGRLVDLDEMRVLLDSEIQAYMHGYKRSAWDFICALRDVLDNAPAIIPADKEDGE